MQDCKTAVAAKQDSETVLKTSLQHLEGSWQGDTAKLTAQTQDLRDRLDLELQRNTKLQEDQQVTEACLRRWQKALIIAITAACNRVPLSLKIGSAYVTNSVRKRRQAISLSRALPTWYKGYQNAQNRHSMNHLLSFRCDALSIWNSARNEPLYMPAA